MDFDFDLLTIPRAEAVQDQGRNRINVSALIPRWIIHKAALSSRAQRLTQYVWAK